MAERHANHREARLREGPGEEYLAVSTSVDFTPLLEGVHQFDKVHTVLLWEGKVISRTVASAIIRGLEELESDGVKETRAGTGRGVHSGEAYLTRRFGPEIGGQINTARSSGDLVAVSVRLLLRQKLLGLMSEVLRLREVLASSASRYTDTIMPSYSHLQHAQTTTFGHYLMSWVGPLERDFERAASLYSRVNRSPAGAAIGTGSDFLLDRRRAALLLGFDGLVENTKDAVFNVDCLLETSALLAIVGSTLSRLAHDLILWSSYEFRMVELADRYTDSSSIMPQKKNPHSLELLRGVGSLQVGRLTGSLDLAKTSSDAIDPSTMIPQNLWPALGDSVNTLKLMRGVILSLKVNEGVMLERATASWAQATDLADLIAREARIPFRTAHQVVGRTVSKLIAEGRREPDISSGDLDSSAAELSGKPLGVKESSIRRALDPLACLKARKTLGGPSPLQTTRQIERSNERLREDAEKLRVLRERLERSDRELSRALEKIKIV